MIKEGTRKFGILFVLGIFFLFSTYFFISGITMTGNAVYSILSEELGGDDFESGNLNSWNLERDPLAGAWMAWNINPQSGTYHAYCHPMNTNEPASSMIYDLDTTGYEDLVVEYYRKLVNIDSSAEFKSRWYDGSSWHVLEETLDDSYNDGSYVAKSFNLPTGAADNPAFQIRFDCTGSAGKYCYVDTVSISGGVLSVGPSIFDNGTFNNTYFNGSHVLLYNQNLSGTYISDTYDAGYDAYWENMTVDYSDFSIYPFLAVDGSGEVYLSLDNGNTFSLVNSNYGRTSDGQDLFSDDSYFYILSNSNREVFRSDNYGTTWSLVNDSFADSGLLYGDSYESNLYVVDASGDVYLSTDFGVTWLLQGDFNGGATNNCKGFSIDEDGILYAVDGSGSIFSSENNGVSWTEVNSGYGGGSGTDDMECDGTNLFILFNKAVYRSTNYGVSWSVINDSFTPYANDGLRISKDYNGELYIADAAGRIFTSTDAGVTWIELDDFNDGAGSDTKGLGFTSTNTNLTFYARSCNDEDCIGEDWVLVSDLDDLGLGGNPYFQYLAFFESPFATLSSFLQNVTVGWTYVNVAPNLSIVSPTDSSSYGTNESLSLNFCVNDSNDNLDSCWYNIDGAENLSLSSCENSTFDVNGSGSFVISVFANDSFGYLESDSANFNVFVGGPNIVVHNSENFFSKDSSVTINYTPSDFDLDVCELWGNYSGSFLLNQTSTSPQNSIPNNFSLTLEDNTYFSAIRCNDSVGNSVFSDNLSFTIDTLDPLVSLSGPSGEKDSRNLTIEFSAADSNIDSCWFNVYQGASVAVSNTSLDCSITNYDFSVSSDADFVLYLYVNDSASNFVVKNTSFSVDTSSDVTVPPSSSGGGGGGGGGGSDLYEVVNGTIVYKMKLDIPEIKGIILPGEEKSLVVSVKNSGVKAVNKCRLKSNIDGTLESDTLQSIASGEIVDFPMILIVNDALPEISVECLEGSIPVPTNLVLYSSDVNAEITNIELGEGEILVKYVVGSKYNFNDVIHFTVSDNEGALIKDSTEEISFVGGENYSGQVIFELGSEVNGLLNVGVDYDDRVLVEDTIVYGDALVDSTGFVSSKLFRGPKAYGGILLLLFFSSFLFIGFKIFKNFRNRPIENNNYHVISHAVKGSYDVNYDNN